MKFYIGFISIFSFIHLASFCGEAIEDSLNHKQAVIALLSLRSSKRSADDMSATADEQISLPAKRRKRSSQKQKPKKARRKPSPKQYACTECTNKFARQESLDKHMLIHANRNRISCEGISPMSKGLHKETSPTQRKLCHVLDGFITTSLHPEAGDLPDEFICYDCTPRRAGFSNEYALQRHVMIMHAQYLTPLQQQAPISHK